jgi:alpha/beta superfamily hydrolase
MEARQVSGPAGPLEAVVRQPAEPKALAVICHPHPLYGGTMQNKVVTMLDRGLHELGLVTWRFNFRGVGGSAGTHDHGDGEQHDLAAVVEHATQHFPGLPLWLAGFSFGAWVSARQAATLGAAKLISVAPPVGKWSYDGVDPGCPWTVLQGDADEVIDAGQVFGYFDHQHPRANVLRFDGAGHFFHGRMTELRERLQQAVASHLP